MSRRLPFLFSLFLLAGCALPLRERDVFRCEPIAVGTAPGNVPAGVLPPRPRGAGELIGTVDLDLALLTEIAFENSPEIRRSWQMAQVAAAQRGKALCAFVPTLSATGSATRQRIENPIQGGKPLSVTIFSEPSLHLNYVLFTFGATRAAADAFGRSLAVARFQYNRSLQTLLYRVQVAYFALDSALATLAVREVNLRDATELQNLEEIRMQSGLSNRQSLCQARAGVLRARGQLEAAQANVERARAALAEAVGVRISSAFRITRSQLPEKVEALDGDVEEMVAKALSMRQDLMAAHSQWQAARSWERAARDNFLPQLVISADGTLSDYRNFGRSKTFSASVGLSWDVFGSCGKSFQLREQRAQRRAAREGLRAAELQAAGEVWTQYFAYRSAHRQLLSGRALLEVAQESFSAAEIAYRSGLCGFLDLLSAQTALASARETLVAAENAFSTALAALAYAVGDLKAAGI
ncbi:MAG: TolC family protein [Puniceicoccales bacterium]|jgi:outer membrane protein TolC|nr:TolC family protein [Puniceicoccales bacterium]